MIDFYKPKTWKTTHMKEFTGHLCISPIGTKIFNANLGCEQVVNSSLRFVFRYKNGMMQLLTFEDIAGLSTSGKQLTVDYIKDKLLIKGLMNWKGVTSTPDTTQYLAVMLPCNKKEYINFPVGNFIANKEGVEHGDGDYVVCPKLDTGTPDLRNAFVVNGLLFPLIYSRQSFRLSWKMNKYVTKIEEQPLVTPAPIFPPVKPDTYAELMAKELKKYKITANVVKDNYSDTSLDLDPIDYSNHFVVDETKDIVFDICRTGKEYTIFVYRHSVGKKTEEPVIQGGPNDMSKLIQYGVTYAQKKGWLR